MKEKKTEETLNPIDMIPKLFGFEGVKDDAKYEFEHIKYDSKVNSDYDFRIIRGSVHDGALLFSIDLLRNVLYSVVSRSAYCNSHYSESELLGKVSEINYSIGDLTVENRFGMQHINGRDMYGQDETVYLPVKCHYILK